MSDAEGAKVKRAAAKRLFTMANKQVRQSITNECSIDIVKDRFEELKATWKSVMDKNALYLAYAYPEDEDPSEKLMKNGSIRLQRRSTSLKSFGISSRGLIERKKIRQERQLQVQYVCANLRWYH